MKIKQRTNRLEVVEGRKLGLGAENSRCTWYVGYIGDGHAIREKITNRLAQNLQNAYTENVDAVFAVLGVNYAAKTHNLDLRQNTIHRHSNQSLR